VGRDRGFDGGKLIKGRKRHLQVDTLGLVWGRCVTSANTSDQAGFKIVFSTILLLVTSIVKIFADKGYRGTLLDWVRETSHKKSVLEIVIGEEGRVGFAVEPKRWIVERTWAWFNWSRRLSKDYEQTTARSAAWLDVSAIRTSLRKFEPN
jgi:transposase